MIISVVMYSNQPAALVCDAQCNKAWGINGRPKAQLGDLVDDNAMLADNELDEAPADPGTYEGGHGKPLQPVHNKWCYRECERSVMYPRYPYDKASTCPIKLPDFSKRVLNMPWLHEPEK